MVYLERRAKRSEVKDGREASSGGSDGWAVSEVVEELSAEALEIIQAEPFWAAAGYSLGIVAGFIGEVLML